MTGLQSCLIDVLKPEEGVFIHYERFLSRYSLITVTAIVSQCSLMHETYIGMTEAALDRDIDRMIKGLPDASINKLDIHRTLCSAASLDLGVSVQENEIENRTFASELFIENAKKHSLSNRQMLLRGLNSSAFLNYFFLLEDSLKTIYVDLTKHKNKSVKAHELISNCLNCIISKIDIKDIFEKELYARSKLFFDIKSLILLWDLLNSIRNQIAHANGFYDDKSKQKFKEKLGCLVKHYLSNEDCLLSMNMIFLGFEKHEAQIQKTGYIVVDDFLENIIRNVSISIMESLYVCNRVKTLNQ